MMHLLRFGILSSLWEMKTNAKLLLYTTAFISHIHDFINHLEMWYRMESGGCKAWNL